MSSPLKIFCVYFDDRPIWRSDCVEPLQAGRARTGFDLTMTADDTGDNISAENVRYGEMTAWYWVWKNYLPAHPELEYLGFSHYRRFLDFTGNRGGTRRLTYRKFRGEFERCYTAESIMRIIGGADLVMRRPTDCGFGSIREQMAHWRPDNLVDFDRFAGLIRERHPDRLEVIDAAMGSPMMAMELQFVMKRSLLCDFMEWAFGLCREYERRWAWNGPSEGQHARIPALLVERFFTVFVALKRAEGLRTLELPIVKLNARDWRYYLLKPLMALLPSALSEKIRNRYK